MPTALITGGAKRIGREVAQHLAANGWDLIIHYHRSEAEAEHLKSTLNAAISCTLIKADLSSKKDLESLINQVFSKEIDLLINSASCFDKSELGTLDLDTVESELRLNSISPVFLSQAFAKTQQKGLIINFTDAQSAHNQTAYFSYLLSKKYLTAFTQMAAITLAPTIRVNAIAPGWILSPENVSPDRIQTLKHTTPLQHQGKIGNILQAVDYLIENDYVTGEILSVDGGVHL